MVRTTAINGQCLCGQNVLQLEGMPAARAHCHCSSCRDLYGGSFLSATAWHPHQVRWLAHSTQDYPHPSKQLIRTCCTTCGEILFGTNRLGMNVIPNTVIARSNQGVLPAFLAPEMHLFYGDRIIDIHDGLSKYIEGWDGTVLGQ